MEIFITPVESSKRYTEIAEMFKFVAESRQSQPELKIIEQRRKYLVENKLSSPDLRLVVDEFIVRFLAKSNGISTMNLANFIREGKGGDRFGRELIQREIWDLADNKILILEKDRQLSLAPQIKEQLLNQNLTTQ